MYILQVKFDFKLILIQPRRLILNFQGLLSLEKINKILKLKSNLTCNIYTAFQISISV